VTGAAETGEPLPADVAVIGAGVVGTAIARALAVADVSCVLIDAANDVGTGTSKANTAILHTGFDAVPGSLESRLLRRGYELLDEYARRAGIPVERTGALLVAWTQEQVAELPAIEDKARRNGVTGTRRIGVDELYRREPALGPGALGALVIPGESIICPWTTRWPTPPRRWPPGPGCGWAAGSPGSGPGWPSTRSSPLPAWSAAAGW
jgi:glycerol-3-phosphate dehydrogenase